MSCHSKRFAPNIGKKGRVLRGLAAAALFASGFAVLAFSFILSAILFVSAAFVFFEAWRGWCAFRACGIKTKY